MLTDKYNYLAEDVSVSTVTHGSTQLIGSELDLGATMGEPVGLRLRFMVTQQIVGSGACLFTIYHKATSGVTSSNAALMTTTISIAESDLVAGYVVFDAELPATTERYLRASVYLTSNASAGQINVYLVPDGQTNKSEFPS